MEMFGEMTSVLAPGWPDDPWQILAPYDASPQRLADAEAGVARLVEELRLERSGGPAVRMQREFMLQMVSRREHLAALFGEVEGFGPVVDRVDEFLRRRIRGPERVLSPAEAVELAERHQEAFRVAHAAYGEAYDGLSDRWGWTAPSFFEPTKMLCDLDVVWVDAESASRPVLEWAGDFLRMPWHPERPTDEELAEWSLIGSEAELQAQGFFDLGQLNPLGAEDPESLRGTPDFELGYELRESLHFMNQRYVDWPGTWCLAPVRASGCLFDLDAYFELWSGGASLWVGREAIEVRTDYAVRFSELTCAYNG